VTICPNLWIHRKLLYLKNVKKKTIKYMNNAIWWISNDCFLQINSFFPAHPGTEDAVISCVGSTDLITVDDEKCSTSPSLRDSYGPRPCSQPAACPPRFILCLAYYRSNINLSFI